MTLQADAARAANTRKQLLDWFTGELGEQTMRVLMDERPLTEEQLRVAESFRKAQNQHNYVPGEVRREQQQIAETARRLADITRFGAQFADLYLAETSMCELVEQAGPTMPDQPLREDDPLTSYGLVFFQQPLADIGTHALPIHAMLWFPLPSDRPESIVEDGICIIPFTSTEAVAAAVGDRYLVGKVPKLYTAASVVWPYGNKWGEMIQGAPPPQGATPEHYQQLLAAFWALSKQENIASPEPGPSIKKGDARRFSNAGIQKPDQPVRIVRLHRRQETPPHASNATAETNWKHQWWVNGYWRNTYYRSIDDHRQQFIPGHWKGPEDKPVLGGEKVIAVKAPRPKKGS
ncbi:hypothetical protein GCM10010331_44290 [Streptomyces xanthochromogenes]|uniref:hypothetical protein n=1 Tax=Streptomyces xanthochromogenes TaxID=67384 RepID=UPI001673F5FB|nr:hypothetical protein [Streptomyces xanthochromogenes]GHB51887.1 hypothetical protein GCM10010331_44290 [Streptomyces xanthochromogenes]